MQVLEKYFKAGCSDKVIAGKFSFQPSAVAVKKKRLMMDLKTWKFPMAKTHWSKVDIDELRALAAPQTPIPKIAAQLTTKRTTSAVYSKLIELGIKYTDERPARAKWTDADVSLLRTLHSRDFGVEAIRDCLSASRTLLAVKTQLWNMKLYLEKGKENNEPTRNEDTSESILVKDASRTATVVEQHSRTLTESI